MKHKNKFATSAISGKKLNQNQKPLVLVAVFLLQLSDVIVAAKRQKIAD
jgi:hypothetical protein